MCMSRIAVTILAGYAAQVAASCAYGTHLMRRAEEGAVPVNTFGYTGTIGPLNWAGLEAANEICSTGTRQSPIDMVNGVFTPIAGSEISLAIANAEEGAEFENLGTTVEVVAEAGQGSMTAGGQNFQLQQFHFHLPSEHLDNGTSHAMEMHMVFEAEGGAIGVVGVYIDHGAEETELLNTVFNSIDAITTPGTKTKTAALDMAPIVAAIAEAELQTYSGSLTTPPCSEDVSWFVSTANLVISTESFNKVRDVIGFNSRFPQNTPGETNVLQLGKATAPAPVETVEDVEGETPPAVTTSAPAAPVHTVVAPPENDQKDEKEKEKEEDSESDSESSDDEEDSDSDSDDEKEEKEKKATPTPIAVPLLNPSGGNTHVIVIPARKH